MKCDFCDNDAVCSIRKLCCENECVMETVYYCGECRDELRPDLQFPDTFKILEN